MSELAFIFSLLMVGITAVGLYRKLNPQGLLMLSGLLMLTAAFFMQVHSVVPSKATGMVVFDLVRMIEEVFLSNLARAGFMIMTIGGYVAFMNNIKATNALVYISMKPLGLFRRYPYLAATIVIPIGQLLFITTPSAAGLGLLLVASVYPVLISLGVSQLTALSVIAAATLFDQGPGSANTAMAAELIGQSNVEYFITHQLPLVIPTSLVVMVLFYFNNRYFDKKDAKKQQDGILQVSNVTATSLVEKPDVPLAFALLPVLPLALLIFFSPFVGLFQPTVTLGTTTAMLFSLFLSLVFVLFHTRSVRTTFNVFASFWKGMGNVFTSVVTLIVASEVFSKGLIGLGFIDSLVGYSSHIGLSGLAIPGNKGPNEKKAALPLPISMAAPKIMRVKIAAIATQLGLPVFSLILPLQLAASMGRAASPIAGVIVAIAGVAGVSSVELARRNTFPLIGGIVFLILYHLITF